MRAVRFHDAHDVRVEDVPAPPRTLAPTEVLLRPRLCGICGSDLREYAAGPIDLSRDPHPLTGAQIPQILGHEFSADVEAIGEAVTNVKPGMRVTVMPEISCGQCESCRRGMHPLCPLEACVGMTWQWGGMAELAVVEACHAIPLPDNVSYEQGALIEPAAVAVNAVQRGGVGPGASVLVTGAGPIGALSVLAAHAAGASQIFLSEPNRTRAAHVASFGTSGSFDPASVDVGAEVRAQTGGVGVDVAIECSGNDAALRTCLKATRARGTVTQVGMHVKHVSIDVVDLTEREISLVGSYAYSVDSFPGIAAQIASGTLPVERIVTSRIDLERAVPDGFEALADSNGGEIKVLLEVNS